MTYEIEDFNKRLVVAGLIDAQVSDVDSFLKAARKRLSNVAVQFFDPSLIAGPRHLYFATLNALKAFRNGTNISRNLAVECILYASAQRQISKAHRLIGIKSCSSDIAVSIVADDKETAENSLSELALLIHGKRDDNILELSEEKMAGIKGLFGISETELATQIDGADGEEKALSDLVVEHMALLVTRR